MAYLIKELLLDDQQSPFGDWFAALDRLAAAKVQVAVARMEQGNLSNVQWFRGIGEFRIDWGPGLRIYLAKRVPGSFCCSVGVAKSGSKKTSNWR